MLSKFSKTKVLCIIFVFIALIAFSVWAAIDSLDDNIVYQNQFLEPFGIDFITTEHEFVESDITGKDLLTSYIYIELSESEKSKMEEYLSYDLLYSISAEKSTYNLLNKELDSKFSKEIKTVENGYFAVYFELLGELLSDRFGLQNIKGNAYTAIIYDSDNAIIYLFYYSPY